MKSKIHLFTVLFFAFLLIFQSVGTTVHILSNSECQTSHNDHEQAIEIGDHDCKICGHFTLSVLTFAPSQLGVQPLPIAQISQRPTIYLSPAIARILGPVTFRGPPVFSI